MGQYQQWLYYQEVDRRLRADLEALEIELTHIQEQAHALEQTIPSTDNVIIHTLAACLNGHTGNSDVVLLGESSKTSSPIPDAATASSHEKISPALYGWGRLANFGQEHAQEPLPQLENAIPVTPHPQMALLPEDMVAFFDAYDQTDPQLELPWWLSKTGASANGAPSAHPIDRESIRTNSQVERWRGPISAEQPSEKGEDLAHE